VICQVSMLRLRSALIRGCTKVSSAAAHTLIAGAKPNNMARINNRGMNRSGGVIIFSIRNACVFRHEFICRALHVHPTRGSERIPLLHRWMGKGEHTAPVVKGAEPGK